MQKNNIFKKILKEIANTYSNYLNILCIIYDDKKFIAPL